MMERRQKLLSGLDLSVSSGVEIGPLSRPTVAKSEGKILYVDYTDTESLRKNYSADPGVVTKDIVEVDAVWGKQSLRECLGGQTFDYTIASHVVEHVPDLITWLEEIGAILKPDGSLRLVVPDRRFTLDYLRRESRLCDVLNAYVSRARAPLPIAILDFFISARQVDVNAAWEGTLPVELPRFPGFGVAGGVSLARDRMANDTYHDVHCWVFTPRSFAGLFAEAAQEGLIHFRCEKLYDTEPGELEFIVILRRCDDRQHAIDSWRQAASSVEERGLADDSQVPKRDDARAQKKDEVEYLQRRLAAAEEELLKAESSLQGILNSRSWRLTEPLRELKRKIRR